jgi:hypothetical protein
MLTRAGQGVGEAECAGPDVDDDLPVEERCVFDVRLAQDAAHLGTGLLPAPPVIAVRRRFSVEQLGDVGRAEAALAKDGIPRAQPPRDLRVALMAAGERKRSRSRSRARTRSSEDTRRTVS